MVVRNQRIIGIIWTERAHSESSWDLMFLLYYFCFFFLSFAQSTSEYAVVWPVHLFILFHIYNNFHFVACYFALKMQMFSSLLPQSKRFIFFFFFRFDFILCCIGASNLALGNIWTNQNSALSFYWMHNALAFARVHSSHTCLIRL